MRFRAMRRPVPVYVQDWTDGNKHALDVEPEHDYRLVAALLCFVAAVAVGVYCWLVSVTP